jgi:Zn-finger protein
VFNVPRSPVMTMESLLSAMACSFLMCPFFRTCSTTRTGQMNQKKYGPDITAFCLSIRRDSACEQECSQQSAVIGMQSGWLRSEARLEAMKEVQLREYEVSIGFAVSSRWIIPNTNQEELCHLRTAAGS